ncbi:RNA-binding region-containing protein 3-like [Ostrea edulis]|uniref:RNA-binding region-containing protein 3-like n=1 Tax=Ostrea edulis TaxID=37623 RepID=UPI0024AEDEA5|nr:RNA-binding region-containing protein 3-like [Ostrea edulis]
MGTSSETNCILYVRHLPSELNSNDKEDLLIHFGATTVKVMGTRGSMKHTAFAMFPDHDSARKALNQLHQLEVCGCKLVVEFAKSTQSKNFPSLLEKKRKKLTEGSEILQDSKKEKPDEYLPTENTFKTWQMEYPRNPKLHYLYPPPTVSIVTNIANALASYPKFYVQVLHLMNKMNLPPPFGTVTSTPPIPSDKEDTQMLGKDQLEAEEMEVMSEEESEIESDGENKGTIKEKIATKRPMRRKSRLPRKKPKLAPLVPQTEIIPAKPAQILSTKEVFEQTTTQVPHKKIELILPETVLSKDDEKEHPDVLSVVQSAEQTVKEESGFGKIQPVEKPPPEEELRESDLPYTVDPTKFLSMADIRSGRISPSEMKNFSVFKNYDSGEIASRLYIKNLAKHTTEQDLVNIYGGFVNWSEELEKNIFDIRLMKEGRMKGQAFITFANENSAHKALKATNGLVLNSKPMAVQYARSAKAKEPTEKSSKK